MKLLLKIGQHSKIRGITLLETLIVLVIALTILFKAIPLGQSWFETIRITQMQSDLISSFTTARTVAQVNLVARVVQKTYLDDSLHQLLLYAMY